mgnify:CR=1 FL=1
MILSPMRYKSYTWPHNPRVYSIDYRRTMVANKVPFGGYQLQDLGAAHRVMEGEGEFVGAGAYFQFQRLASVFYDKGPGLLVHPLWQVANTYFVSLRVEQAPRPDYVRYSFQFWEENGLTGGLAIRDTELSASESGAGTQQGNAPAVYHRVVKGDTLWGLAVRYGVALEELTALNPQIKNPNLIQVGEEVRVR